MGPLRQLRRDGTVWEIAPEGFMELSVSKITPPASSQPLVNIWASVGAWTHHAHRLALFAGP